MTISTVTPAYRPLHCKSALDQVCLILYITSPRKYAFKRKLVFHLQSAPTPQEIQLQVSYLCWISIAGLLGFLTLKHKLGETA